jgi:hypothetical protein
LWINRWRVRDSLLPKFASGANLDGHTKQDSHPAFNRPSISKSSGSVEAEALSPDSVVTN